MAKKRKHSAPAQTGPKEIDPRDSKLRINTYEDVADSEDEFHMQRDRVALDEGPDAKRRRRVQEEDHLLENSEEEVLGYDEDDDSSDGDDDDDDATSAKPVKSRQNAPESENGEDEEDDAENAGDWGVSRKKYYNADNIETEADALEEEAEAKRLQQKRLQKMTDADFGFDEDEWLDNKEDGDDDVVTEVLRDIEITEDTSSAERLRLLQTRHPEFEFLADDYVKLQPILAVLQDDAASQPYNKAVRLKARALTAYVASLSMYFAVLTSTTQDHDSALAIDPAELRDHGVMESLLQCRELWRSVESVRVVSMTTEQVTEDEDSGIDLVDEPEVESTKLTKKQRRELAQASAIEELAQARRAKIAAAEDDMADVAALIPRSSLKKTRKSAREVSQADDDNSDFGEEESLSARALEEKAQKKKSLRFYTSQIAQKSNRRADAGRDAGGDADLPYRERLRDRQARLNAEAEKRAKTLDKYGRGTALGHDSDEEDGQVEAEKAAAVRDDEDEYYDMVAKVSKQKKSDKTEYAAALAQAEAEGATVRVVEGAVGEDGKRAIGYVIEKNKGLQGARRNKLNKNPRAKKRAQYAKALIKQKSMKATYSGGEGRGGYGGEKTGIKTGLVKSIKL